MTAISDNQVNELLREAEERLARGVGKASVISAYSAVSPKAFELEAQDATTQYKTHETARAATSTTYPASQSSKDGPGSEPLSVRVANPKVPGGATSEKKDNAGSNWFNMPKTDMTPQFKRDWQVLRLRALLDPKRQKKALHKEVPQYSHVGEIIEGPTGFYSGRLTKRERKRNIMEEMMSTHDQAKMGHKYAGIQKQKTSGKKTFYKKLIEQRRRRK